MRQCLRPNLNDHAFCALDLLFRPQNIRITLQRRQDRLIESKRGDTACGRRFTAAKGPVGKDADLCKDPEEKKQISHYRFGD